MDIMKTMINIKADKEVKRKAQELATDLGFSLSALVNAYLKQFVREEEIHFSTAQKMTKYLEKIIGEAEKDLAEHKNVSSEFSSAKELGDYLRSL